MAAVVGLLFTFNAVFPRDGPCLLGPMLMKAKLEEVPEKFAAASPRDQVTRATQPWLILHGDSDSLVPVAEGRDFARTLQAASPHAVIYVEFPAAQHAFDMYYCHRSVAAVELSARFLVTAHRRVIQKSPGEPKTV